MRATCTTCPHSAPTCPEVSGAHLLCRAHPCPIQAPLRREDSGGQQTGVSCHPWWLLAEGCGGAGMVAGGSELQGPTTFTYETQVHRQISKHFKMQRPVVT